MILICPRCKADVRLESTAYVCEACAATYPIIAGIPDFRVYPDPYIDLESDRAKGQRLADDAARMGLDFAGLVRRYYAITPEVTPDQAERFTAHHLAGLRRGDGIIARLDAYGLLVGETTLDLGCGTGGFLAALAQRGHAVVGVDIAFRWLIVAQARLHELGLENRVTLVCACADHLPFKDESFALVTAENLLEHAANAAAVIDEAARVLSIGGGFMGRTVNRFAPGPEPHVNLWGIGLLPRRMQRRVVERIKGVPYHISLLSWFEVRSILRRSPTAANWQVTLPRLMPDDIAHQSAVLRWLFTLYASLARIALLRPLITFFAPYLDIVGWHRRERYGS